MFGTWKYDPETDEVQNIRQAFDPITARSNPHQACNRCHEKKLKCSGDKKDGCDRCLANQLVCQYPRQGSKRGSRIGRDKKPRRRSADDDSSSVASGSRSSKKPSPTSRNRRLSPERGHSNLPYTSSAAVPSRSAYEDSQNRMLDSPIFSMLTDEDAFDLHSLSESVNHAGAMTSASASGSYLAPVTGSTVSYHQSYDEDYQGYYQQNHSLNHVTSSSAAHPNMATAGPGYAGDHGDDYMQYQHQQHAYQHGYWGSGNRGGGR